MGSRFLCQGDTVKSDVSAPRVSHNFHTGFFFNPQSDLSGQLLDHGLPEVRADGKIAKLELAEWDAAAVAIDWSVHSVRSSKCWELPC